MRPNTAAIRLQPLVGEISWSHNLLIMARCKDDLEREFYLRATARFGWTRSISPVTWQSDRGLQIESIVATVPMIRHAFISPDLFHTELSQYNAWEIFGPGVDFGAE